MLEKSSTTWDEEKSLKRVLINQLVTGALVTSWHSNIDKTSQSNMTPGCTLQKNEAVFQDLFQSTMLVSRKMYNRLRMNPQLLRTRLFSPKNSPGGEASQNWGTVPRIDPLCKPQGKKQSGPSMMPFLKFISEDFHKFVCWKKKTSQKAPGVAPVDDCNSAPLSPLYEGTWEPSPSVQSTHQNHTFL